MTKLEKQFIGDYMCGYTSAVNAFVVKMAIEKERHEKELLDAVKKIGIRKVRRNTMPLNKIDY
jgi:hypothetical protein